MDVCPNGHPRTPDNTGSRGRCKACRKAEYDAKYARPVARETLAEMFARRVIRGEGCWEWDGRHTNGGYSYQRSTYIHRLSWEIHRGPIPVGMEVDHLCRNRGCVNPDHLEPVTRSENIKRSLKGYLHRSTCRRGLHDITDPKNVTITGRGPRTCRPCQRDAEQRYRDRRKALAA